MSVWNLFSTARRAEKRADRLICEALAGIEIPVVDLDAGCRAVVGQPRDTYRASVYVRAEGDLIHCHAATGIFVERDLLGREMMLQLLEANRPEQPGAFVLMQSGEERIVALCGVIDARATTAKDLRSFVERLLDRFQKMVSRLYAMELIVPGPEPFTSAPRAR